MFSSVFAIHPGLEHSARLPTLAREGRGLAAAELTVLFLLGIAAATLSGLLKLSLQIPGHNIIRVIFPMALGLAVVPRRGSGSIMGIGGFVGAMGFHLSGVTGLGTGATTSLVLTGFFLDAALVGARAGKSVYLRLALAGLAANMAAFVIRLAERSFAVGGIVGGSGAAWWMKAPVTYPVCGLLAGIISAMVWFRFSPPKGADQTP
jgi:hypothetical protein